MIPLRLRALSALAPVVMLAAPPSAWARSAAGRTLQTHFVYKATVPEAPAGRPLRIWVPVPSDSEWQTIRGLTVDSPAAHSLRTETKYGNRMVYVEVPKPQGKTSVVIRFDVDRKEITGPEGASPVLDRQPASRRYLAADSLVPLGGRYAEIAREVTSGSATAAEKVRAIFEHVVATMQYDYKKESPKYAQGDVAFVCDYKKGNCSDLHSYIVSLGRTLGIPAILEYGFPLTGIPVPDPVPAEGVITGYHCWTWIKDPERGWTVLDASDARRWLDANRPDVKEKLFGSLELERSAVAFSRGRDIDLVPKQHGPALNNFIYPYAESGDDSVKVDWEVRYALVGRKVVARRGLAPGASATGASSTHAGTVQGPAPEPGAAAGAAPQDVQRQLDELRRMVIAQAEEIRQLREQVGKPAAKPAAPPPPISVPSREAITAYGFLRVDGIMDNGLANNAQAPLFIQSPSAPNVGKTGNRQLALHPRLTRIGLNFVSPNEMDHWKVTGKVEMDWQNGQGVTVESRPLPRVRHAYIQLSRGPHSWLFGQTWDVISPLLPSPNDDTLMWNTGNLGDRRPQIRYSYESKATPFNAQAALGLTGAIDAKDLDANTVRDGEDSGLPNVQARFGYKKGGTSVGLWGHHAWDRTTKPTAGKQDFTSYSVGVDGQQQLTPKWDLKGELWFGKNLSDFRGGIGQGVDPATGAEVRAHGGWLELGYQSSPRYRVALGYTEDRADDNTVPAGGRLKNYAAYWHNRWRLAGSIEIGANYLYWTTRYKGLATGIDHRINAFIQHNF